MKTQFYTISTKQWAYNLIYKLYWWLLFGPVPDSKNEKSYRHTVYDHLGIIDTLGHFYSEGKFTYSYSEELKSYQGIKLPFGYCLEFDNEWEPYIILKKFHSLLDCY
jgi:hypothetical protein